MKNIFMRLAYFPSIYSKFNTNIYKLWILCRICLCILCRICLCIWQYVNLISFFFWYSKLFLLKTFWLRIIYLELQTIFYYYTNYKNLYYNFKNTLSFFKIFQNFKGFILSYILIPSLQLYIISTLAYFFPSSETN